MDTKERTTYNIGLKSNSEEFGRLVDNLNKAIKELEGFKLVVDYSITTETQSSPETPDNIQK
jgi:hypothetical protein